MRINRYNQRPFIVVTLYDLDFYAGGNLKIDHKERLFPDEKDLLLRTVNLWKSYMEYAVKDTIFNIKRGMQIEQGHELHKPLYNMQVKMVRTGSLRDGYHEFELRYESRLCVNWLNWEGVFELAKFEVGPLLHSAATEKKLKEEDRKRLLDKNEENVSETLARTK